MKISKKAFTMIELVFVVVVLGILSAVAIPKFAATRTDAQISKGRSDVASIRSAIITERQTRLITGDNTFIAAGTAAGELDKDGVLFSGVLTYGITDSTKEGHWHATAHPDTNSSTYDYNVNQTAVSFKYTRGDGRFDCANSDLCSQLTD